MDSSQQKNFLQDHTPLQDKEKIYREIDNIHFPVIHIRQVSNLAISPVNFFAIGMSIFMFSVPMMNWCDFKSPGLSVALLFGGIGLIIIGIHDWYQGKTFLYFIDYLFGLTNLTFYYSFYLARYNIISPFEADGRTNSIGTFFALFLATLLICVICSTNRGIMFIINFIFCIISCIFMMIWQYNNKAANAKHNWVEKITGYFMFFSSICFWFTGLSIMINVSNQRVVIPVVHPKI